MSSENIDTIDFVIELKKEENKVVKRPKNHEISRKRFKQEIETIKKLKNKEFIPVVSFNEDELVMKYLTTKADFKRDFKEITQILDELYEQPTEVFLDLNEIRKRINFVKDLLKTRNPLFRTTIEKIENIEEEIGGNYVAHKSTIHGNLTLDHFLKDEKGKMYLIDFSFSGNGNIEDDIARFEVDEFWNPSRRNLTYKELRDIFNEIENYLSHKGKLNKETTKFFVSLANLERTPYVKYYTSDKDLQELLFEYFLLNSISAIEGKDEYFYLSKPDKRRKILIVSWGSKGLYGGVNTYIRSYASYLEKLGYDFFEIGVYESSSEPGKLVYEIRNQEIYNVVDEDKLFDFINVVNPDLVHIHNYTAGVVFNGEESLISKLKNNLKKPVIATLHGCLKEFIDDSSPYVKGEENIIKEADILTMNKYLKKAFMGNYPNLKDVIEEKTVVVEPASSLYKLVDEVDEEEIRKIRNKYENEWIIVYHGRITKEKGVSELIDAVRLLREDWNQKVRLLLIGRLPPEYKNIEDFYGKSLPFYVEHIGPKQGKELATYLLSSHISAQPSHYDSFNYSLLESLLFEIPSVSYDVFAPEEYYSKYITRAKYSNNYLERVNNLKAAILMVIEKYDEMKKYAVKARRELITTHSLGKFVFSYNQIYENLVER
jgi:glycosyltransferase involved in cell wall biosynthesis/thiamine kinase-like enzyme